MHPFVNTAISAARAAGQIICRGYDDPSKLQVSVKTSQFDLVSNIDKQAESEIRYHISKAYPRHQILGEEEGGDLDLEADVVWIIDPLDGTLNFLRGIPYFSVSIGIMERGVLTHGVIFNPLTGELFHATKGRGAQLNGQRIRVKNASQIEDSVASCDPRFFNEYGTLRRYGSSALDMAYVACGKLDFYLESPENVSAWDLAAGALIVKEAGGFVSDLSGTDQFMQRGEVIACNPKLFSLLLAKVAAK